MASLNKQIQDLLNNRPKYKINDEAFQNQNLARSQAFGRNAAIQTQQENIEQEAGNASAAAKDISSSTSSLLSTIAAINANKNTSLRGLAQDEAGLKTQQMNTLYNVNNQMIDEQDKAWNYNVNEPFQQKLATLVARKKAKSDLLNNVVGGVLGTVGNIATAGTGSIAGKLLGI